CNHISPAAKRMVLYDVRYNDLLRELFNKNMIKEGDRCNRSFNQLLKKVCAYGYISKETYQSYKIPYIIIQSGCFFKTFRSSINRRFFDERCIDFLKYNW